MSQPAFWAACATGSASALPANIKTVSPRTLPVSQLRITTPPSLVLFSRLDDFDLHDSWPFIVFPLQPHPAANLQVLDGLDHVLVGTAAVLGRAADPVRHVAAGLFLAVRLDLHP